MADGEEFVHPKPFIPKGVGVTKPSGPSKSPFTGPGKNLPMLPKQDLAGLREKAAEAYALSKGGAAGSGCVAIKWTWWQAMKRFKDKVVDNIPGPVESPTEPIAMLMGGNDFVVISQKVAGEMISTFGGSAGLQYDRRPDGTSLLTGALDGLPKYVSAYLYMEPDGPGRMWMLKADKSIGACVEAAVGYTPTEFQDYSKRGMEKSIQTGKWWDMANVHVTFDDYIGKWIRVIR